MSNTRFTCPACQKAINSARPVPDGTRLTCPGCRTGFVVGAAPELAAPAAAFDFDSVPPAAPVERPRKAPAARRPPVALIAGGAAVVLLLIGFGAYLLWPAPKPAAPPVAKTTPKTTPVKQTKPVKPAEEPADGPTPTDLPDETKPAEKKAAEKKAPEKKPAAPPSFADWEQDFDAAKAKAVAEKKDLLVLFNGSDWCVFCRKLAAEVLHTPEFREGVADRFVLVNIDFPRSAAAKRTVADPGRNERLSRRFDVEGYPRVVLADAAGRPYAVTGYERGGADAYLSRLDALRVARDRRDEVFADVTAADPGSRPSAVKAAVGFLAERGLVHHYVPLMQEWGRTLRTERPADPDPAGEQVFLVAVELGLKRADGPAELTAAVGTLDAWKKEYGFKTTDAAAEVYLKAGVRLSLAGDPKRAADCFKTGLACKPTDPRTADLLGRAAAGRLPLGSGTGFAVADGYALTNQHVVAGPGRLVVQPDGAKEPVPAELVAADEKQDIALVKFAPPAGRRTLLPLAGPDPLAVGEEVAVLGYPLGDALGSGLKLTPGAVSGTPEPATDGMLLLSNTVNPGNSGGPLCDAAGRVVGMVTAKTSGDRGRTSYGLARPAADLHTFLKMHLPGYKPAMSAPPAKKLPWSEVTKQARPGVVMVLKVL